MRVRVLSGNQTGQVVDLPQPEAEAALATGFAERAPDPQPAAVPAPAVAAPAPEAFEPDATTLDLVTDEQRVAPKSKRKK